MSEFRIDNSEDPVSEFRILILRIQCRNSVLIMTNGIRKVRQGVDIFDKRILDSCKFISDRYL